MEISIDRADGCAVQCLWTEMQRSIDMDKSVLEEKYRELEETCRKLKRQNELLRECEQIYRVALGMTTNTVTIVDIPKRTLNQIYNAGILDGEWEGVQESMENAPESIIATGIIHPEDCQEYRRFYDEIYAGKPYVECMIRVMGEKQGWVWFNMYSKTMYDEDQKPLRAIVFSEDITTKKIAEIQHQNYREVVAERADFIWEANLTQDRIIREADETEAFFADKNFETYSDIAARALGTIPEEYCEAVRDTFSREGLLNAYARARREVSLEYPFRKAGTDEVVWLRSVAYLTTNYEGEICAIVCSRDVSQFKKREDELRIQAERDPLCGLYNRRCFEYKVREYLSECDSGQSILMIVDVDNFKTINDTYGHAFGDQVLIRIAETLQANFRREDVLARVGGDEYMALLTTGIAPEVLAHKLHRIYEELKSVRTPGGDYIDIGLSIGVSRYRQGEQFEDLYQNADTALYEAKRRGKNQFVEFTELMSLRGAETA